MLLLGLAVTLAACGGGAHAPTPTPTVPAPVLATVPAGTVIDFDRAAELYKEGDYEGALTIYSAAALNGSSQQKQAGLWAVARIHYEQGDHDAAGRTVQAFRATGPTAEQDRQALLLLGTADFQQGDMAGARAALEQYVKDAGPAWPYAQLYLAQIDAKEIKLDSAVNRINQALAAGLPPKTAYDAQISLAGLDVQLKKHEDAIAAYRKAADEAPSGTEAAEALWLLADEAQESGDASASTGALEELISNYPATQRALDSLTDSRVTSDSAITQLDIGTVYMNHQVNDKAADAFQAVVAAGGDGVAQAQYDLGILSERAEDWQGAVDHYQAAIDGLAPGDNDSLRAQASWDKGTVLERQDLISDAIDAYGAVADYSDSAAKAPEGLFRAGFLSYQLGNADNATVYWQHYFAIAGASEDKSRADYWLATAASARGDSDSEATYLQAAATDDPLDYYGMRAAARIAGDPVADASTVAVPTPDWAGFETWLAGWAGTEDTAATAALFSGEPWLRAVELYEAGLTDRADEQWKALLADNAARPWLVYRMIRKINEFDRPWVTSPAAADLTDHAGAPPEALQLEYPLEYLTLVQKDAADNGYSPLLLLALVRQESLYDPSAVSPAGATGLTQIVESTAEEIAQQLGVTGFKPPDLLRANVNLEFGAHYLGSALSGFGGELGPALAGYNAGPGTAGNWRDASGADPDLFLETIDFSETRLYVEVVLENYARYLYAYGVTATPSLALP